MNNIILTTVRQQLADAKATLRITQDEYKVAKAQAEQIANVDGKNEAERARKLTIAVAEDRYHNRALAQLREAEHIVDRLEAQLESILDDRRAWEWAIRSELIDALGQTRKDDTSAFDGAMDDQVDRTWIH